MFIKENIMRLHNNFRIIIQFSDLIRYFICFVRLCNFVSLPSIQYYTKTKLKQMIDK